MICENCEIKNDGNFGSGRFCCRKCATTYSSNKNREVKNSKISNSLKGKFTALDNSWFKSGKLLKQNIEICPICKQMFNKSYSKVYCSKECYLNDKDLLYRGNGSGGYRKGSGVGKKGWYKGYWCDSSWELAFVIYNLEHNIEFKRNKLAFSYLFKDKTHNYYPDFEMNDGSFIEIKGYETLKDIEKYKTLGLKLSILYKKDIQYILDYVIKKYSKNYIVLYEK
jgi:hypothetical protein